MGFDVIHLNLHKTFSTPHGGGGPGSGPVGCKALLAPHLPDYTVKGGEFVTPEKSIGSVRAFYGNFLVVIKALTYIITLGREGIREAAENAVLNANYLMHSLSHIYDVATKGVCMHEFVLTLDKLKREHGVSAMDIAKAMIDYGMHPPTMYFPLIVSEALMLEPTETESADTLDEAAAVLRKIYETAITDARALHEAPKSAPVRRLDEVKAAREPKLRFEFMEEKV
ncbi:putative glycine dehydrogenase (decarboxylating) subunit 2 [bioreactor metagenome]|uniref:glycine dehydrogenase (aminomethyl-transferring) n=1 Tax=bioreactor metagenome TaxID=1076179 RepID=A0A645FPP7_9ZZZZ